MKFKQDVIQAAISDRKNGMTVSQIQRKYGIKARSTAFLWLQQAMPITGWGLSDSKTSESKILD